MCLERIAATVPFRHFQLPQLCCLLFYFASSPKHPPIWLKVINWRYVWFIGTKIGNRNAPIYLCIFLQAAERSIRFYHGLNKKTDIKLIQEEIERLKNQISNNSKFEDLSSEKSSGNVFEWKNVITNPGRKALIIGIVLALLNHISGNFALINYAGTIFKESGSVFGTNESAIIVAIILCLSTILSPLFINRLGRRVCFNCKPENSTRE